MGSDIVPGVRFPDYELSDHTAKRRSLSELQGQHPMIVVLSRGGYCGRLKDSFNCTVKLAKSC
jgi:peroxiredoxin